MLLADLGADVIKVEHPKEETTPVPGFHHLQSRPPAKMRSKLLLERKTTGLHFHLSRPTFSA